MSSMELAPSQSRSWRSESIPRRIGAQGRSCRRRKEIERPRYKSHTRTESNHRGHPAARLTPPKIISYAQGYMIIEPPRPVNKRWKPYNYGGIASGAAACCIIRQSFLGESKSPTITNPKLSNLMLDKVSARPSRKLPSLLGAMSWPSKAKKHAPRLTFSTALSLYDGLPHRTPSAKLLQAQQPLISARTPTSAC